MEAAPRRWHQWGTALGRGDAVTHPMDAPPQKEVGGTPKAPAPRANQAPESPLGPSTAGLSPATPPPWRPVLGQGAGSEARQPRGYRTTPVTHPWIIESWLQCSAEKFGKTTGTTRVRWAAGSSELRVSSYHTRCAVEMQTSKVFCIWRQSYIPFTSKTFF